MASWPNVEALLVQYLTAATGYQFSTRLPSTLEGEVPLGRVTRGPGTDDEITDSPIVDVETFTARQGSAVDRFEFAESVRTAMHNLTGTAVDGHVFDAVSTTAGPSYVEYGNPSVDRLVASYRVESRKRF